MTLRRKPRRAPGESPILRKEFIRELAAQDHAGDLAEFIDDLADEQFDGPKNPFVVIAAELGHLVDSRAPDKVTPIGRHFFRSWLRHHGIDPDTGRMTVDGLAFFQACLDSGHDQRRNAA